MPPSVPFSTQEEPGLSTSSVRTRKTSNRRTLRSRRSKGATQPSLRRQATEGFNVNDDGVGPGGGMSSTVENSNDQSTALLASPNASMYSPTPFSSYGMMGGGMPYYGGGTMMGGGPFSGIYQILFGVQNVIFSLTQAVQLVGTNQQALQHALDSVTKMVDSAISTFAELRALEAQKTYTPEEQRRRKRLQALRWALVMGGSWLVYKIIRRLTSKQKRIAYHAYSRSQGSPMSNHYQPYGGFGSMGMGGSSYFGSGYGSGGYGGAGYY